MSSHALRVRLTLIIATALLALAVAVPGTQAKQFTITKLGAHQTTAFRSQPIPQNANITCYVFVAGKPLRQTLESVFGGGAVAVRGYGVTVTFVVPPHGDRLQVEVSNFRATATKVVVRIVAKPSASAPVRFRPEDKVAHALSRQLG